MSYPHKLSPIILNFVPVPSFLKNLLAVFSSTDVDVKAQNVFSFPFIYGMYLILFGSFANFTSLLIHLNKQFFLHFVNPLNARKNKNIIIHE